MLVRHEDRRQLQRALSKRGPRRCRRKPAGQHVEVTATGEDVDELVGDQIAVTGDVEIVDFPERGKILVFRATSVAVLEEDEEDEEISTA